MIEGLDLKRALRNHCVLLGTRFSLLRVARQSIFDYFVLLCDGKAKRKRRKRSKVRIVVGGPESKFCLQVFERAPLDEYQRVNCTASNSYLCRRNGFKWVNSLSKINS